MSTAGLPAGAAPVLDAAFVTGDFEAADAVLAADLATARAAGDRAGEAAALHWQAMALLPRDRRRRGVLAAPRRGRGDPVIHS